MEKVLKSIFDATSGDAAATVGIQALMGHSSSPFGVYWTFWEDKPDFKDGKARMTISIVSDLPDHDDEGDSTSLAADTRIMVLQIQVYAQDPAKVEKTLRRVDNRLHGMRGITQPTSEAVINSIRRAAGGPSLYDVDWRTHQRAATYTVRYRNDITE